MRRHMRPHCVRMAAGQVSRSESDKTVTELGQNRDRTGTESNAPSVTVALRVALPLPLRGFLLSQGLGLVQGSGQGFNYRNVNRLSGDRNRPALAP